MRLVGQEQLRLAEREPVLFVATAAASAAAAAAPRSAAPPTFLQLDHLNTVATATDADEPHTAYLGMVTHITGPLDHRALATAITDFVRAHDGLRTWFERTESGFVRRVVDAADIAFESAAAPEAGADRHGQLKQLFGAATIPFTWPAVAFAVEPDADETGFRLLFAADHGISDGISQSLAALELTDRYRAEVDQRPSDWPATDQDGYAEYAHSEYARCAGADADRIYPLWESTLARTGFRLPGFALDLGLDPTTQYPTHTESHRLLDSRQSAAFDEVLRAHGARFSAAMFAVLALTEFELTGRDFYWALNVVATRGAEHRTAQGWFCNFVPITFPLSARPDFRGTLATALVGVQQCRHMAPLPVHAALARLQANGLGGEITTAPPSFVTLMDLRPASAASAPEADTQIFTGEGQTSSVSIWLGRNDIEYLIGVGGPAAPTAREQLSSYRSTLQRVMIEIADTGNFRP